MHNIAQVPLAAVLDARYLDLPLSEKYRRLKGIFPRGIERGYEFFAVEAATTGVAVIRISDGKVLTFDIGIFEVAIGFEDPVSLEQLRRYFQEHFGSAPLQCT